MAEIFGISVTGGSSGEGATLTVIAPQNTQSITIKKGEKTYTKQGTTAEFKNLEAGTWEITSLSTTGQVSGKKEVTIVLQYSSQTAYFAANIQVTYPAGSTCTCSKNEIVLNAPDTTGSHIFVVPEAGEWIVSSTDGELTDSESVIISSDGESKSITLEYFTATIITTFPTDCTSVTCKKDAVTLSVPSGELPKGSYTFSVHETGEWVLECTNGVDTDTETVNVTEEKEYTALLEFALILFENGSYDPTTGGWTSNNYEDAIYSRESSRVAVDEGIECSVDIYNDVGGICGTANPIDITRMSTLNFVGKLSSVHEGISDFMVGVSLSKSISNSVPAKTEITTAGSVDINLDVSKVSGKVYVFVAALRTNQISYERATDTIEITKIVGELE